MSMYQVPIEIGGLPIGVRTEDPAFAEMLRDRYGHFVRNGANTHCLLDVETFVPEQPGPDEDVSVTREGAEWLVRRGDFRARWNPTLRRGRIRQSCNPYSIDAALRIIHSLMLANEHGFLLHGASAIRNGKAFVFSGVSGAGKTTISRLAPQDVTLLTDEISYLRAEGSGFRAFGTPFSGELARIGEDVSAPLSALYLLAKGPDNKIEPVRSAEAAQAIMRNILFFAEDAKLVKQLFETAVQFVSRIEVSRLTFFPDPRVWELIG